MSARKSRARLIVDRRRAIQGEIADHNASIAKLEAELGELDVAERTLSRLAAMAGEDDGDDLDYVAKTSKKPTPRAPSNMTVRDMVETLMRDPKYADGISNQDAIGEIRSRWKPDIDPNHVRPLAWRMVKEGKWIKNDDGRYTFADKTEGTPEKQASLV